MNPCYVGSTPRKKKSQKINIYKYPIPHHFALYIQFLMCVCVGIQLRSSSASAVCHVNIIFMHITKVQQSKVAEYHDCLMQTMQNVNVSTVFSSLSVCFGLNTFSLRLCACYFPFVEDIFSSGQIDGRELTPAQCTVFLFGYQKTIYFAFRNKSETISHIIVRLVP